MKSNQEPNVNFSLETLIGKAPTELTFDGSNSFDDKEIIEFTWYINEVIVSTGNDKFSKLFSLPGNYNVKLEAKDNQGLTSSVTKSIEILSNSEPSSIFSMSASDAFAPASISFDASLSFDDEGIKEYLWDFGDGKVFSTSKSTTAHAYDETGIYKIRLTVLDHKGMSSYSEQTLTLITDTATERNGPLINISPLEIYLSNTYEDAIINISDESLINFNKLVIKLNNTLVPSENISIDTILGKVVVDFNETFSLISQMPNVLSVSIVDEHGNHSVENATYIIDEDYLTDNTPPVIVFNPSGGELNSLTPQVNVYFGDDKGVDYSSISLSLNGVNLPSFLVVKDIEKNLVSITLNEDYKLKENDINILEASVSDISGNTQVARVGFDTKVNKVIEPIYDNAGTFGWHNCAIVDGGKVKCWGANWNGLLGYGNSDAVGSSIKPEDALFVDVGTGVVTQLVSGAYHSCVLFNDKSVKCWGWNAHGSLGTGSSDNIGDNEVPASINPIEISSNVESISAGWAHTCAILENGNIKCWGKNQYGQLGYGTNTDIGLSDKPSDHPEIFLGEKVISISAGHEHTCAVLESKNVKCWGYNGYGQLGYDNVVSVGSGNSLTPLDMDYIKLNGPIKSVVAGGNHSCAILESGDLKCWGRNHAGQLGYGFNHNVSDWQYPMGSVSTVDVGGPVQQVTLGDSHTCALLENGKVKCWGLNNKGQLGYGNIYNLADHPSEIPSLLGSLEFDQKAVKLIAGKSHTCAVMESADMKCWGENTYGQLGYGHTNDLGDDETVASIPIIPLGSKVDPEYIFDSSYGTDLVFAHFNPSQYYGHTPLDIEFNAINSYSTNSEILNYSWDFGDGNTQSGVSPIINHTYNQNGVFVVTLSISDDLSRTSTFSRIISVNEENIKPVANYSASSKVGKIPFNLFLNAEASFDSNGFIQNYHWDFGDGNTLITSSPTTSHQYQTEGDFVISLRAMDNQGKLSDEELSSVSSIYENEDPISNFSCTSDYYSVTCNSNESVDMDGLISAYEWNMGDGTTYVGPSVSHIYDRPGLGKYTVSLKVIDNKKASSEKAQEYSIDHIQPVVTSDLLEVQKVNSSIYPINFNIVDDSSVSTTIFKGSSVYGTYEGQSPSLVLTLDEGVNQFSYQTVDGAGNSSELTNLPLIEFDNKAPILSLVTPILNERTETIIFQVSGSYNEEIIELKINDNIVSLNSDNKTFSVSIDGNSEGPFGLNFQATDIFGNVGTYSQTNEIFIPIFNSTLIATSPSNESAGKVHIEGLPGSIRLPGQEIKFDTGFFTSETVVSNSDGSFSIDLDSFDQVNVTTLNPNTSTTEEIKLSYNFETTLAGTVKDTSGNPLMGVTVTIDSSGQSVVTDGNGEFTIVRPATGDQNLVFDASTIPVELLTNVEFSTVTLAITLGSNQPNILDDIIYLAPLLKDGTETVIENAESALVVSTHAQGVEIDIPAGVAQFPNGTNSGSINMIEIDASKTSIPTPSFAKPKTVIALEPSGLKFSQRVELTLPNVNEFPAGTELLILSKNSSKGTWEIDGKARVSEDGNSVKTEEGKGISHFSEVFAVPLFPSIKTVSSQDRPGADTFDGDVSTAIALPSYKALGKDVNTSLIYRSSWAHPSALIKNIIDVPRSETDLDSKIGPWDVDGTTWVEPDFIDVSFYSNFLETDKFRYEGMPNKSLIAYGVDLNDFPSGSYPYFSKYEIHLKQLVLATFSQRYRYRTPWGYKKSAFLSFRQEDEFPIEEIFPSDLSGDLFVYNMKDSSYGTGWDVAGVEKILNPKSTKIALKEADGRITSYLADDSITSIYKSEHEIKATNLNDSSNIVYSSKNKVNELNDNYEYSRDSGNFSQYSGRFNREWLEGRRHCYRRCFGGKFGFCISQCDTHYYCNEENSNFSIKRDIEDIIKVNDNKYYVLDNNGHLLRFENNIEHYIVGGVKPTPTSRDQSRASFCSIKNNNCGGEYRHASYAAPWCYSTGVSAGMIPDQGDKVGSTSSARFNNPTAMIKGKMSNTLLVADTGNHKVKIVDLNTNELSLIAGTGQTYDIGDGGKAIDASLRHPQGLAYDIEGNLYISTRSGYIRKIDTNGYISTIAGKQLSDGGKYEHYGLAKNTYLNNPAGLTYDNKNHVLYVSDTNHHRVLRIDLDLGTSQQVAGNNSCNKEGDVGDNSAALNANLCNPDRLGLDSNGNLLIFDKGHNRIRRVNFSHSDLGEIAFSPKFNDNSKLIRLDDGTFRREFRNGSKTYYDANGLQISTESLDGKSVQYDYDSESRISSIIDPVGGEVSFEYSGDKLSTITQPAGDVTNFVYNNEKLEQVSFPDGTIRSFDYDENGFLIKEYDQRNNGTTYAYNEWNRLEKTTRADGTSVSVADSASKVLKQDDSETSILKGLGLENDDVYSSVTDANGVETKFAEDENGYVSEFLDGKGRKTQIERNLKGRVTKVIRPDSSEVSFNYDQNTDDLLSKTDSLTGITLNYGYDSIGNLINQTDAKGNSSSSIYDFNTGYLTSSTNQLNQSNSYTYNSLGLVLTSKNNLGHITSFEYDEFGNLVKVKKHTGEETYLVRDAKGNIVTRENSLGERTLYTYDVWNRLLSVTSPKSETTSYNYLATGELSKITDPIGNITSYDYNVLGQMIQKIDPNNNTTTLRYDGNGNVIEEVDPNRNIKTFEFNSVNQLVKKNLPDDTHIFDYDVRGNIISASNNISQIDYEYVDNEAGQLVSKTTFKGKGELSDFLEYSISYEYNNQGSRTLTQTPVGNFNYQYDDGERLTSLVNHNNEIFSFEYDSGNRLSKITRPGSETVHGFDNFNYLNKIIHTKSSNGDTVELHDYSRNAVGVTSQKRSKAGNFDFTYDSNNQLVGATNPEGEIEAFSYDPLGNRLTDSKGSYVYDSEKQRLESDYRYTYSYDNNGNLTGKVSKDLSETINYHFDSLNKLVGIEYFEGSTKFKEISYYYDVLGRRILKDVKDLKIASNSLERRFIYDGNQVLAQLDETNNSLSIYTHSNLRIDDTLAVEVTDQGKLKGVAQNSGSFFYLKDHLGTVNDIVNSTGELVQHYAYSSFGKILKITNKSGDDISGNALVESFFTYTNRVHDKESGLYYYRARYYDSGIGRFMSSDPHPGVKTKPITHNSKYVYENNNPSHYIDPNGKLAFTTVLIIGALVGGGLNAADSNGKFNWKNFLIGATVGAASAASGYGVMAAAGAGAGIGAYTLAGAASGLASSTLSLLLHGKSLTSDRSLTFIASSTVLGGVTGAMVGSFASNIRNSNLSYSSKESIIGVSGEIIGVESQLLQPVFNNSIDSAVGCPPIDEYSSRPECF